MKNKTYLLSTLTALILGFAPPASAETGVPAQTVSAVLRDAELTYEAAGRIEASETAAVASKITGYVSYSAVMLGKFVKKGETLIKISSDETAAKVAQAKANFDKTSRELARESALLEKGASTRSIVKDLQDAANAARAALNEAESYLEYLEIKAPADGVIVYKNVSVGDLAMPGKTLFQVENRSKMQVAASAPSYIALPAPGAKLAFAAGGKNCEGVISEISPTLDRQTYTRSFKLDIANPEALLSGEYAIVYIPYKGAKAVFVPQGAVRTFGQISKVYVVENGRTAMRIIKTSGAPANGEYLVVSGLVGGETLLANPARDGGAN